MITTLVTFAGNLAQDPELRCTTVSGKAVAEFRVLVNRRVKDITDQWTDAEPTPFQCKVWGSAAPNVAESLQRGEVVATPRAYWRPRRSRQGIDGGRPD